MSHVPKKTEAEIEAELKELEELEQKMQQLVKESEQLEQDIDTHAGKKAD